ncbi:MAG: diguanylate cyclase [Anaerolineales bacterium]|nr:diguanylate cyclase [Anaerolineales bacterium]
MKECKGIVSRKAKRAQTNGEAPLGWPPILGLATLAENSFQSLRLQHLQALNIFSLDRKYRYLAFTEAHQTAAQTKFNYIVELGRNMLDFFSSRAERREMKKYFDRVLLGEQVTIEKECPQKTKGSWREIRCFPLYAAEKEIIGLTAFTLDIEQRKQIESATRINSDHLQAVIENIPELIMEVDRSGRLLFVNHVLKGYRLEDALGRDVCTWVQPEYHALVREKLERAYRTGKPQEYEIYASGENNQLRWYLTRATPVKKKGKVEVVVLISVDITEKKKMLDDLLQAKQSIENMNATLQKAFEYEQIASRTDTLTGIYNRRYFFEFSEYLISSSQRYRHPISAILMDIDGFKQINDTFGHLTGDDILIRVAELMRGEMRASDVLARYGGDEFIVLVPNTSLVDIRNLIERIRRKIERFTFQVRGARIKITISAGVASLRPGVDTPTKLVHEADRALYLAKENGRNRVSYPSP